MTEGCNSTARLLGAYVDGTLDTARTLEVDDHLSKCETCVERVALDRAIRGSLKKTTKTHAGEDVKARMLAAMAAEATREVSRDERSSEQPARRRPGMLRHWRTMIPMASAAAIALAWGFASKQPVVTTSDTTIAGFGNDDMLRQFVSVHSHPMRPEASDPSQVRQFERDIGVPVRVPRLTHANGNARFVGGRLLPTVNGERAALLQYEVAQGNGNVQRVSIFVYDPRRVSVRPRNSAPRAVGTAQVQVGQEDGVSVAVTQHGQAGYFVASDLDPESSAKLVAAADSE